MRSIIEKMRPFDAHQKALQVREKCGIDFYQEHYHDFIDIPCPACGSRGGARDEFVKYGFHHKRCQECLTLFCSPRPTDTELLQYYNNYDAPKYWTELLLSTDVQRKILQYKPRVNKILNFLRDKIQANTGVAADIGAGSGAFALALKETGFFQRVLAFDFSEDCVRACAKGGIEAYRGSVEDIPEGSVNLLTMNDLIEHISDPLSFLRKCYSTLMPDGFIEIATPNGEGFDFKILKEKTVNITPPEHLNYFNPTSIKILLKRAGFSMLRVETPGILDTQIVMRELKQNTADLRIKNEFLHYLLYETNSNVVQSFQRFLQKNLLSSHMLIFAEKV